MSWTERAFRLLLRFYPASTRDAYGDDMVQLFNDQLRRLDSSTARAALWLEAIADTIATAPGEHRRHSRRPQTADGPVVGSRPLAPDLAVAGSPILLLLIVLLVAPGSMAPMFDSRVSIAGVPGGSAITGLLGALAVFGVFGARRGGYRASRSALQALAASIPALFVLIGASGAVTCAAVAAAFIVAARYRMLLAALVIPFAAWILFGPAIVLMIIGLGNP